MPKLSIIIPAYNIEEYIEKCVCSVVGQYVEDVQIIIVDDGSTDNTGTICDCLATKHFNVSVFHKENGGLSNARNYGIKKADGEYIAFLDGDDFWTESAVKNILERIECNKNVDVIIGRYINYYKSAEMYEECEYHLNQIKVESSTGDKLLEVLFDGKTYDWYACINIIRKAFLIENELYFKDGSCFEDALWTPEVLFAAKTLSYIDEPFYIYLQNRPGAITGSISEKIYRDKQFVCENAQRYCKKHGLSQALSNRFMGNCNRTYVSLLADSWLFSKEKRKQYWKEIKKYKEILWYSGRVYQKCLYILWMLIGIRGVSYLLYLRAEWVRKKQK